MISFDSTHQFRWSFWHLDFRIWILTFGFQNLDFIQHLDFSIWISDSQFSFLVAFHQPDDLRSDPILSDLNKKSCCWFSTTGCLIFLEHFPYSWFEKFYRLIYSIVFLLIAVDFWNEGFLIIRRFPRHLFSVLYTDRSGIHHLQ